MSNEMFPAKNITVVTGGKRNMAMQIELALRNHAVRPPAMGYRCIQCLWSRMHMEKIE